MPVRAVVDGALVSFFCPACNRPHSVDSRWSFDGSVLSPTLHPSVLVREYRGQEAVSVCHSFVRNGLIEYLPDCSHAMAGQTILLPLMERQ